MFMVAVLLMERLGMLVDALLFSKVPIRATCFGTTAALSECCSMTIVGGGVTGIWSSNSSECASLLVAMPESSSRPKRKWWLWTVESVLSLPAFWLLWFFAFGLLWFFAFELLAALTRLFSRKSISTGSQPTRLSFHDWSFESTSQSYLVSSINFTWIGARGQSIERRARWQKKNKKHRINLGGDAIGKKTFLRFADFFPHDSFKV